MSITDGKELSLKGESLKTLASDYTCWSEFVAFLHTRDKNWASQNLDTALSTYDADGVWVYDKSMVPIYSACSDQAHSIRRFPLPPAVLRAAFNGGQSCHFFVQTSRGLLEVRGAKIHVSADTKRTGAHLGQALSGRALRVDGGVGTTAGLWRRRRARR